MPSVAFDLKPASTSILKSMELKTVETTTAPQRTRWAPVMALGLAMFVVTAEMTVTAVTLPSLLTALAPAFWGVIAGRLVQGLGATLTVAAYLPIVMASVAPEQRGRAIGSIITIMTVGGMAG